MKIKSKLLMLISAVVLNLTLLSEGYALVSDEIHSTSLTGVTESVSSGVKTTLSSFFDLINGHDRVLETHVNPGFLTSGTGLTATVSPFESDYFGLNSSITSMKLEEQQGHDWLTLATGKPGMGKSFAALTFNIASNSYHRLNVLGISTGMQGGSILGSVTTHVAAVPEPEEWAMMMVGVGLVGYQIRRKQSALNRQAMLA